MSKSKLLSKISFFSLALITPVALALGLPTSANESEALLTKSGYTEYVSLTNSSFNDIGEQTYQVDFTGWTRQLKTGATGMIIDLVKNFDSYCTGIYYLRPELIPDKSGFDGADNKVLMINSASSSPTASDFDKVKMPRSEAYVSNDITLKPNSFYQISVSVSTNTFDESNEQAAVYLSEKQEDDTSKVLISAEGILNRGGWTREYFFVETSSKTASVNLELWLGGRNDTSSGVVFFDNVEIVRYDETTFRNNVQTIKTSAENEEENVAWQEYVYEDERIFFDGEGYNFDFEQPSLDGWTNDSNEAGNAQIVRLDDGAFALATGLDTYPGSDFSYGNKNAMALWAEKGHASIVSKPIPLPQFALYKITLRAKPAALTEGSFSFEIRETDQILTDFAYLDGHYTPMSGSSSAISTAASEDSAGQINCYNEISYFVKGHDRYDSQFEIVLNLGSEDSPATGAVLVDNIVIEEISPAEFNAASSSLVLSAGTSDTLTITNGYFNDGEGVDPELGYPVAPSSWTLDNTNTEDKRAGIINIYNKYFDKYDSVWAQPLANPGSPIEVFANNDVNNVFMMWNKQSDHQSATSSTFSLSADTYYRLSLRYLTMGPAANVKVMIIDDDGVHILNNRAPLTDGDWKTYECFINAGEASSSLKLVLNFGTEDDPASGYAFFDDIVLESTATSDQFESADVKVDLSGFRLNLDPNNEITTSLSSSNAFTGPASTLDAGGGIVKGENNDVFGYTDEEGVYHSIDNGDFDMTGKNVLVVYTGAERQSYTYSSKFTIETASSESYYSLKFKLLTSFPGYDGKHEHDGKEVPFGLKIGLDGFNLVENLTSNNGWSEITILFKSTSTISSKFVMTLASDECLQTAGYAYVTDIQWTGSNSEAYSRAENNEDYGTKLFTTVAASAPSEPSEEETPEQNTASGDIDESLWLLIPSIIMAVAVIVAVVGFSIRHIKIKKVEKARKEEYDRNDTLNADVVTNEARSIQQSELDAIDKDIASLENEMNELEEEHKQESQTAREKGKVTSETEKHFKQYAQKRAKIQKSIDELKEHRAYVASPDYTLAVEKRVRAQMKDEQKPAKKKGDKKKDK